MKNIILLLCLMTFPAWAQSTLFSLPDNVSVIVMQANDGKVLFDHHSKQAMTPASTTKVLTSYVALKTLGPDFTFSTQVYESGKDIWIRFSGDPSLSSTDFMQLLTQALTSRQNQTIQGNIYIDHSAFSPPYVARGWAVDDIPWYYAAPIHGIIIDENQWVLNITPPEQINQPVSITSNHPQVQVKARVIAVDTPTSETLCQIDVSLARPYQVQLEGCWPQDNPPQNLKIANQYPLETAQNLIAQSLSTLKIHLQGNILTGRLPSQATLLAQHRSPPISELIKPVLQDSNNIYTEALTKALGGKVYGRPTFQAGSYHIQQTLKQQLALSEQELSLSDGSGVSFLNLISPNTLAQTLRKAYSNAELRSYFINALAFTGINGTLKGRLTTLPTPFAGKTGSMTHVSALAGYYGLDSHNPLIYVIMVNHAPEKAKKLKQFEDQLLISLINSYFTNNSSGDTLLSN